MSKEIVLEVGESKGDYPKLHQHVSPVLRSFARDRRDVKLTHTVDANGVSTMTIVAQPAKPTAKELADNKATSADTDAQQDAGVVDDVKVSKAKSASKAKASEQ